ncbi:glycosyltransferase 8 domain-containing protein 1 [Protopterus annectens]|uniref:glycosyltransferase 8 domain-containing protein 1 n=1 Tax=Protopterus annectens TaxID=7888 RepID=UPI001CF9EEC5|nr:glycosyltransferase 8 domain-containing protein 1 [Protopterus annectens]
MSMRRVNLVLLVLAALVFVIVLHHHLLSLADFLRREGSNLGLVGSHPIDFIAEAPPEILEERTDEEVPIVITAVDERLGGLIAAVNSIVKNTNSNVVFYIVSLNDTVDHLRTWVSKTELKNINYKVIAFDPHWLEGKIKTDSKLSEPVKPLTFARFYLPNFVPEAEKVIYLDDDVIVQGDIHGLYDTPLKPGHAAAFSEDCDSVSSKIVVRGAGNQFNYLGFLDYKKESIRKLGMKASSCTFNPGVIVANLTEWRHQNITQQLESWMERNVAEDLYSRTLAGSVTTPPLLIVFYKQHSSMDPLWHVRHLGSSAGQRHSASFIKTAKLLHWNGHYKPWGRTSFYPEIWEKWYIPDPTGQFRLIRRHAQDYH